MPFALREHSQPTQQHLKSNKKMKTNNRNIHTHTFIHLHKQTHIQTVSEKHKYTHWGKPNFRFFNQEEYIFREKKSKS